jgi:hypothetical protein
MNRDYELHSTNYVMQHFRHLMTEVERAADDAVVLTVVHDGDEELQITFRNGVPEAVAREAEAALRDGVQVFRRRTRERIILAHQSEVCANACPQCGRLPATPKAKMCIWCSYSWRESTMA